MRAAGFDRPLDLLLHFPYDYVDLDAPVDTARLQEGDRITVCGTVQNEPKVQFLRKGLRMTKAVLATANGNIEAVWFNQKYIAAAIPHGKTVCVTGKVKKFRRTVSIVAPVLLQPNGRRVVPLYRPIAGVPQRVTDEAIDMLLSCTRVQGYLPDTVRQKYALPSLGDAFRAVHRPRSIVEAEGAARALSLEKLGYTLSMFALVKSAHTGGKRFAYVQNGEKLRQAVASLPFALTDGQQTALQEIVAGLHGEMPMNRLLQGDVGCGKTVVALLSMYYAHLSGFQSVLMAPTEILALQHYRAAIRFLEPLGARAVLVTGSLTKAERDEALFAVRTQSADIVIGTHALLGADVAFCNASLIITDEQQRFGVNQRGALENKAPGADSLSMTATPIPRTLALCLYGELEQSSIAALPSGRPEIITSLVPPAKQEAMLDYVLQRAAMGEQSYVVCPRIDDDEEENLVSVAQAYRLLQERNAGEHAGVLHGRMKESEKAEVMAAFLRGDVRVLVTTTVIEVGVDVPAAANIVIYHPERYGLSQLHQLRGRVGRGTAKSYCFLPVQEDIPERLRRFCECRDGFALSEYDFAQRGAGDFIGTRQHGAGDALPVTIDAALIYTAKAMAEDTLRDAEAVRKLRDGMTDGAERYVLSITMN